MIPIELLKQINTKGFKDGDLIQLCDFCNWQTPDPGDAIGRCPKCDHKLQSLRIDDEFRERVGIKRKVKSAPKSPDSTTAKKVKEAVKKVVKKKAVKKAKK